MKAAAKPDQTERRTLHREMTEKEVWDAIEAYQLTPEDIISRVTDICISNKVEHLYLFGSYAAGNPTPTSDIDFVVKGTPDFLKLEEEVQKVPTLLKIDLFDYDRISNPGLLKDIENYGKKIY